MIEPLVSKGAVATGLSCGVDCLHSIVENLDYASAKTLKLTHFLVFNEGAFGGSYYSANRQFAVKKIYAREAELAEELGLPIINLSTNLESLMKIPVDQFIVYAMGILVMSISKLIGVYLYSSSGGDYSEFSVINSSRKDISYADILTLHCISHGPTYFYSAGGAKTRFEKFKSIVNNELVKKHLFSCLNQDFNCGVCPKCLRNLLTLDALEKLEDYKDVYNIEEYRRHRTDALEYMVREVVFHGYSYAYLLDIYNIIKKREPDTIEKIEKRMSINNVISERDYLKKIADGRQRVIRAYKTLMSNEEVEKLKKWFSDRNIKHVILYYYSYCTDMLVLLQDKIGISIDYIVEDVKEPRKIQRLPFSTVNYPDSDAIIICNLDNVELTRRKLEERTRLPIYFVGDFFDLRRSL